MYSVLPALNMDAASTANVNITPITTLVMYELNGGQDPGPMFRDVGFTTITSKAVVGSAETIVRNGLAAKLTITPLTALNAVPSSFSMMYDSFSANGVDLYDKALDNVGKVTAYSVGGVTLTTAAAVATNYTASTSTNTATAASLDLMASPSSVKSDGSTFTTITVTALNSANAAVSGVTVTMSTNSGILGASTITTNSAGIATVTFTSGANKINRTATITATAGAVSAQIPVQVVDSTVTVASTASTLPDDGSLPVTLTVTAKDAGNNIVPNAAVTLSKTGAGNVTLTPASGTTNGSGQFTATATGTGAGAVTVTAAALGATATTSLTVSPSAAVFSINQQTLNGTVVAGNPDITAMKIGDTLAVRVNAPTSSNVTFATTTGQWNGSGAVVTVPVVLGSATATLTTTQAGVATVQVYDPAAPATSDTLTVGMTSATAASITIQASPSVVPKSVGTTTGSSVLIATVRDADGFPVGDAPVLFSIVNPTGGGETVSPVVVLSAATTTGGLSLGEARTSFTSGSQPSGAPGVQIRASVVGTAVATEAVGVNLTSSGNDAAVIIGGTAGSVAFGQATEVAEGGNGTTYVYPMSVLVADSNGNPAPLGTVVNLSVWPIAWSTGANCTRDLDAATSGTFYNEDANENLFLDAGEDGARRYYPDGPTVVGGKVDGLLTPTNSAGGTLPAAVMTDASGVATFNLTYPKSSAIWVTNRIRARTVVQGTETMGEVILPLGALESDVSPCRLPDSPFLF